MTLRITLIDTGPRRHIRVEGQLTSHEIAELDLAIGGDPKVACLHLENLRSADTDGLAALRRLRADGIEMRDIPPHLAWRIDESGAS